MRFRRTVNTNREGRRKPAFEILKTLNSEALLRSNERKRVRENA